MFSGIIEETGRVKSLRPTRSAFRLEILSRKISRGLRPGSSIAINGACLTMTKACKGILQFDVLKETLRRTNLRFLRQRDCVNLERSLRLGQRVGGHFVTGHVDGVGRIKKFEKRGKDYFLEVTAPSALMQWVVPKGSIAVDGISLTIAEVRPKSFAVWIIPHTREVTNLRWRQTGDGVNLEADLIGKYTHQFLLQSLHKARPSRKGSSSKR